MFCYYSIPHDTSVGYDGNNVFLIKGKHTDKESNKLLTSTELIIQKQYSSYLVSEKKQDASVLRAPKKRMLRVLISDYCNLKCEYCKVQPNIKYEKKSANYDKIKNQIEAFLDDSFEYPVSFNGKMRFKLSLSKSLTPKEVEAAVLADPNT